MRVGVVLRFMQWQLVGAEHLAARRALVSDLLAVIAAGREAPEESETSDSHFLPITESYDTHPTMQLKNKYTHDMQVGSACVSVCTAVLQNGQI